MNKNKSILMLAVVALMMFANAAYAGTKVGTPKVWTVPAVFSCDQEVTFYYDVTDVGFPEGVDLYLWAWQPTEPDAGNGDNSSDFAKLEYLGNNIYKKTMVPTEYFHSDISAFESADWPGFWPRRTTSGAPSLPLPTAAWSSKSSSRAVLPSSSSRDGSLPASPKRSLSTSL